MLHAGRNTIQACSPQEGELAGRQAISDAPDPLRAVIYTFFRRSKARRSYEHAERLRALGIDSPEPVAWSEYRRHGLLCDSYYVCRRSDYAPLSQATNRFPAPDTLPVLEAFARFAAELHAKGIEHEDFNHGNILWQRDPATDRFRFQLIDINRMRFSARALRPRRCMMNLRRLACPAAAFLFILDRYAEARGWNGTTPSCGALFSGSCSAVAAHCANASGSGSRPAGTEKHAESLDSRNNSLHLSFDKTIRTMRSYGFAYYFHYFFFYRKRKSGTVCV